MLWNRLAALGLGALAACGGSIAGSDAPADAGADAAPATGSAKRKLRADKLGEGCSVENACAKPNVCADFDAVDIFARGAACSPVDPCSLVTCLAGETCVAHPGQPIVVECAN